MLPDPTSQPEELDRVVHDTLDEASRLIPLSTPVRVIWRNYPVTAGKALLGDRVICLSRVLLTTATRVRETLLHEYAHHVVFEQYGGRVKPHGEEWQKVMRIFGLEPIVSHDYACKRRQVKPKLLYKCSKCGAAIPRVRPFKRGWWYVHIGCGGRIERAKQ